MREIECAQSSVKMADDVELENPSKKARLDEDFDNTVTSDQAELETSHYSSFSLGETDLKNQRNGNLNENFNFSYEVPRVHSPDLPMSVLPLTSDSQKVCVY